MKDWFQNFLFDWFFVIIYRLFEGCLIVVDFIESFFDIFAGTAKVYYKGEANFLINIFFGHDSVTNAFWAMALIAVVMSFGFCIVQLARKSTDVAGVVKQSTGQIFSNFMRGLLIILLLNAGTVAVINMANVLLDRINFALENASILDQEEEDKTFTDQEYAMMTKILATVANYSVNLASDSRYNVNSCFNAIRADLLSLYVNGFFDFDYPLDDNGHYTWQGALALLATSADLTQDLNLDTYNADVVTAFQTVTKELQTYNDFAPVKSAHISESSGIDTDVLIFLIAGMESSQNAQYNTGNFNDAIRKGYVSGEKSYRDLDQVRKDFDIWTMNYIVGIIACVVFVIIMAICIFTFIVRMFNLMLLYITAPLFVSSMALDDGAKWTNWVQTFVIQLFSGFGMVVTMRLYLIIVPIVISSDLVFFSGTGLWNSVLNYLAQLLIILGGAWAVLQSSGVITGILAGNPSLAAIAQEGSITNKVSGWAAQAPSAALSATKVIGGAALSVGKGIGNAGKYISEREQRSADKEDRKARLAEREATRRQNIADARDDKLAQKKASGEDPNSLSYRFARWRSDEAHETADKARETADKYSHGKGISPRGRMVADPENRDTPKDTAKNTASNTTNNSAKSAATDTPKSSGGHTPPSRRPPDPPQRSRASGHGSGGDDRGSQAKPYPKNPNPPSGRNGGQSENSQMPSYPKPPPQTNDGNSSNAPSHSQNPNLSTGKNRSNSGSGSDKTASGQAPHLNVPPPKAPPAPSIAAARQGKRNSGNGKPPSEDPKK